MNKSSIIMLAVVAAAVLNGAVILNQINEGMDSRMGEYVNQSEQWCNDHNGELYNSMSVVHGGLHCELPNGTRIHMTDVVEPSRTG